MVTILKNLFLNWVKFRENPLSHHFFINNSLVISLRDCYNTKRESVPYLGQSHEKDLVLLFFVNLWFDMSLGTL